jgi:integrase
MQRSGGTRKTGLSPRSAQITRTVLHQALEQALRWDMVTRNVAALTKNPTVPARERHPLTPEQLAAFIEHTREHRLGPLFQVAIATGMRQGELLGLRWSDVDLAAGTLAVRQALKRDGDGKLTYGAPKTKKSRRVIALPAFAVAALEQQRRNQAVDQAWAGDRWADSGLVFTSTIGTPLDASNVTHTFQAELASAGLPRQRFHDLRHAAATIMALQRIPPNVARDVLGHSQIGITMDVYTHTDISEYRRAADAIGAALGLDRSPSNAAEEAS